MNFFHNLVQRNIHSIQPQNWDTMDEVEHFTQQLTRLTVMTLLRLGLIFNSLIVLVLATYVWIDHRYTSAVFFVHIAGTLWASIGAVAWIKYQKYGYALNWMIATNIIQVYIQIYLTHEIEIFGSIIPIIAIPAITIHYKIIIQWLLSYVFGFMLLIAYTPELQNEDYLSAPIFSFGIISSFIIMGFSIQKIIIQYVETKDAHNKEVIQRIRSEEKNNILLKNNDQLLFAQHDLRAPCNSILGIVEVLQTDQLVSSQKHYFKRQLQVQAINLRNRIDALFDQAKSPLLQSEHHLVSINLTNIIHSARAELEQLIELSSQHATVLTLHDHTNATVYIQGRSGEIQRILENLILNAVNVRASHITINLHIIQDYIEIQITDNGPGFHPDILANHPSSMITKREAGTGLGLLGVYANTQAFGGSVSLSNTSDGAKVIVAFPIASSEPHLNPKEQHAG